MTLGTRAPHGCRKSKELDICEQKLENQLLSQPMYTQVVLIFPKNVRFDCSRTQKHLKHLSYSSQNGENARIDL